MNGKPNVAKRRFEFKGRDGWWFDVTNNGITFHRPYRTDAIGFIDPREAEITSFKQARDVFNWHNFHGLPHRRPHPLGLNLYELHCAHIDNLHAVGQMWAKKDSFDEWMAESARMCVRDGMQLMPDGAMAEKVAA